MVDLPISKLSNHAPVTLAGSRAAWRAAGADDVRLRGHPRRRAQRRRDHPPRCCARSIRSSISGTLLCVPVVNVFGFISRSRYLPDRRDLNRSFPGSANGLAGGAAGAPLPDRDRQALADRHRPAHRRHPPHQSAADPLRVPQAPARAGAGAGVRRRGHAGKPGASRLAARSGARSRRRRAELRGRRGAALRRVRHQGGRRRHHRRDARDGHAGAGRGRRAAGRRPARAGADQCLELAALAGGRRVPHDQAHRRRRQRRRGGRATSPTPTRTSPSRCARRAAASSSGARRCPSSTWAMRC